MFADDQNAAIRVGPDAIWLSPYKKDNCGHREDDNEDTGDVLWQWGAGEMPKIAGKELGRGEKDSPTAFREAQPCQNLTSTILASGTLKDKLIYIILNHLVFSTLLW